MPDQLSRMASLRDAASQINSDGDIDALLRSLIESACRHGAWDLGAISSVDVPHGYALVVARHDATLLRRPLEDRWELATSPALVALQRSEPVYIRDARESTEFIGYRREAHERGYCTVLVFPMESRDAEGRPMVLAVSSRRVREVSAEDLAFMAVIVHLGAIAIERAHRQRAQALAAEQLRRVLAVQGSMLQEVLAGGSMETLTSMLGDLLDAPVLVIDFFGGTVLGQRSPAPQLYDDDAWQRLIEGAPGRQILFDTRESIGGGGARRRITLGVGERLMLDAQIEPLTVDGEVVGALLTFGQLDSGDLQKLAVENAKFALGVQLMRSVIRFRFETRTLTELFFEIVERRWRDEHDVLSRARRLGLALNASTRMIVVDYPQRAGASGDGSIEGHRAVTMLAAQHKIAMHVVTVGGGLVCLVPDDGDNPLERLSHFARRMTDTLARTFGREPILVLGDTCEGLEALAREWERCWRMIRIARAFGKSGALGVPELGPLPMLIGAADSPDVRSFVQGTIGRIIEYDRKHHSPYLDTLTAYIRSGCRSQACADAMGLHVTTLRYRLSRISDLFGIDVETHDRRFAVELALRLHNLLESSLPAQADERELATTMPRTGG